MRVYQYTLVRMHMDISANININNHRMNTPYPVNSFACPWAGCIENNMRKPARPIQPRARRVAENNKVRRSRAAAAVKIIPDLFPFCHAISPFLRGARRKFDSGLFPACALHCRRSINCSDFCLSYFPAVSAGGNRTFDVALSSGNARGQIWSETTFWYVERLPYAGLTIEHLDSSLGFRALILPMANTSGKLCRVFHTTIVSWDKFYMLGTYCLIKTCCWINCNVQS